MYTYNLTILHVSVAEMMFDEKTVRDGNVPLSYLNFVKITIAKYKFKF